MSIELIKQLRKSTGAGIADCKKALRENDNNIELATKWLRERGAALAAKKASAIAAEGITDTSSNGNRAIMFELNSQTDFVSKNQLFQDLIVKIREALLHSNIISLEEALNVNVEGMKLSELLTKATGTIGEKIVLRRFVAINKNDSDSFACYTHVNQRISSIVLLQGAQNADGAKGLAMHVAAMNPTFLKRDQVDSDWLAAETDILKAKALAEGKPANIVEKMIIGRVNKLLKEVCFLDQTYILTGDQTVESYAKSLGGTIVQMVRFEVGEGIEVASNDFAAEVAAQMKDK